MNINRLTGTALSCLRALIFCYITAPGVLLLALMLSVPSPSALFVNAARTFTATVPDPAEHQEIHSCAVVPADDPYPHPCLQPATPESDFIQNGDRFLLKLYLFIALLSLPVWCLFRARPSADWNETRPGL